MEREGWYLVVTRGSHRQYKHPTKSGRVTIAGNPNDELAPGTLNSIRKQAGVEGRSEVKYLVVVEKAEKSYSAYVPDLPGCVATGSTPEEVQENIRAAIALHLEGLRQDGLPIPEPQTRAEFVEAG